MADSDVIEPTFVSEELPMTFAQYISALKSELATRFNQKTTAPMVAETPHCTAASFSFDIEEINDTDRQFYTAVIDGNYVAEFQLNAFQEGTKSVRIASLSKVGLTGDSELDAALISLELGLSRKSNYVDKFVAYSETLRQELSKRGLELIAEPSIVTDESSKSALLNFPSNRTVLLREIGGGEVTAFFYVGGEWRQTRDLFGFGHTSLDASSIIEILGEIAQ